MAVAIQLHLSHTLARTASRSRARGTELIVQQLGLVVSNLALHRAVDATGCGSATEQTGGLPEAATATRGLAERLHGDGDLLGGGAQSDLGVGGLQVPVGVDPGVLGQACGGEAGPDVGQTEQEAKDAQEHDGSPETAVALTLPPERAQQLRVVLLRVLQRLHNVVDLVHVEHSHVPGIHPAERQFRLVQVALALAIELARSRRQAADRVGLGNVGAGTHRRREGFGAKGGQRRLRVLLAHGARGGAVTVAVAKNAPSRFHARLFFFLQKVVGRCHSCR